MAIKIQVKRGLKANLPTLDVGEFGLCTDTNELYIGTITGNKLVDNLDNVGGGDTGGGDTGGIIITDPDSPYSIHWLTQAEYSNLQFNNQLSPTTEYHIIDRTTAYTLQLVGSELRMVVNGNILASCDITSLLNPTAYSLQLVGNQLNMLVNNVIVATCDVTSLVNPT